MSYKPTYVDNADNSISIMESTDTISFCKTGTKINTLSAKNVAHKKTGEDLNLCAYDGSSFNPVITINNNNQDCRIMTNLNISGNLNITGGGTVTADVLIGTITNTDNDKFVVNGSSKLVGTSTISDIVIPNNGNIDFFEATSSGTNKVRLRCNTSLASDFTITLPIANGVLFCSSDIIPRQNGGTGLTTIGLAGQVLTVKTDRTGLEYTTPSASSNIPIAYDKGGTGLTSLTASKILQVNSNANGYNLIDLPVGNTYTGSTFINVSATNVISIQNALSVINGGTGFNFFAVGDLLFGNANMSGNSILDRLQIGTNGYILKSNGTRPVWGAMPISSNWTLSSGNLYPIATSTDVLIGTTSNTDNDKFLVQGSTKLIGTATISDIVIPNNGNIDFFERTSFGNNKARLRCNSNFVSDLTITLPISSGVLFCNADTIPRQNGGTGLSIIGSANQVLKVNSAGTALEYGTVSGSSLWSNIGTGTSLQTANSYTYIDLDTNSTYNLLNTDIRVIPSNLSEGQLIKYDSGLGGVNGGMIFGSNSTSSVSGWETAIHAKQFIKFKCATTDIAEFSVNPSGVKLIELKGDTTIDGSITTTGQGSFGSIHTNTFQGAHNTDNKILSTTNALKIQGEVGFIEIWKSNNNNSHLLMNMNSDDAYIYFTQLNNTAYWDNARGKTNQSVEWRFRNASRSYTFGYLAQSSTGVLTTNFAYTSSDDRLKINEELIEDATTTIMKLRPQKYDKYTYLESEINNFVGEQKPQINQLTHEFGFIAQEIYYEIPELRKLISVPASATLIDDNKNMNFEDIKNDPDYSNWGDEKALVHYNSFIPLLTKGFQELHTKIKSQQIADKERITNLETKIATLETENQQQQTKINELTSIIDKLKTANSFEEFKQTL